MAVTAIVLNGASGSGKSTIAAALQEAWPRPLQASGIDSFLAMQSRRFFASDGSMTDGFSWLPTVVAGEPAYDIVPGELGVGMLRASHAYWAATVSAGIDQVIDDVWLVPLQPEGLRQALSAAHVLWVGVRCSLEVLQQRERGRAGRVVGTARAQYGRVHSFREYDVEVDTSETTAEECVNTILSHLAGRE